MLIAVGNGDDGVLEHGQELRIREFEQDQLGPVLVAHAPLELGGVEELIP